MGFHKYNLGFGIILKSRLFVIIHNYKVSSKKVSFLSRDLPKHDLKKKNVLMCITSQGFSRQSFLLFKILSGVRNHQINSDLAQLLLRLDYNKYYTQAGGTLGR